jgi:hypothetical protein
MNGGELKWSMNKRAFVSQSMAGVDEVRLAADKQSQIGS